MEKDDYIRKLAEKNKELVDKYTRSFLDLLNKMTEENRNYANRYILLHFFKETSQYLIDSYELANIDKPNNVFNDENYKKHVDNILNDYLRITFNSMIQISMGDK